RCLSAIWPRRCNIRMNAGGTAPGVKKPRKWCSFRSDRNFDEGVARRIKAQRQQCLDSSYTSLTSVQPIHITCRRTTRPPALLSLSVELARPGGVGRFKALLFRALNLSTPPDHAGRSNSQCRVLVITRVIRQMY